MNFNYGMSIIMCLLCMPIYSQIGQAAFTQELHKFNTGNNSSMESFLNLIKENSKALDGHSKDAVSFAAMKDLIKQEVLNKNTQKALLKWVEYYEVAFDFFKELIAGDPKKCLALLKKYPYLASMERSDNR